MKNPDRFTHPGEEHYYSEEGLQKRPPFYDGERLQKRPPFYPRHIWKILVGVLLVVVLLLGFTIESLLKQRPPIVQLMPKVAQAPTSVLSNTSTPQPSPTSNTLQPNILIAGNQTWNGTLNEGSSQFLITLKVTA